MNEDITEKVDSIWKELNALKSQQNIGASGLRVPAANADFQGRDTSPYPDAREITAIVRVHFYADVDFPPLALCAYVPEDIFDAGYQHAVSYWFDPQIDILEPGHIAWTISSSYNVDYGYAVGRTYIIDASIFSLLEGTATIERIK